LIHSKNTIQKWTVDPAKKLTNPKVKSQPSQDKWIPRYEYDNIKEQTPKCVNSMHSKNNVQTMLSKKHKIPTVESRKSQIIQILEYETEINGS